MADIQKLIDSSTGELVSYSPTTVWADGTAMTDAKVDNFIYRKQGSTYYIRNFTGIISAKLFGIKGDGSNETIKFQKAIDIISNIGGGTLYVPKGDYITQGLVLKNNVFLEGEDVDKTILSCTDMVTNANVMSTGTPAETSITLVNDILIGDNTFTIQSGRDIIVGDFIRFKSSRRCTRKWDQGTPIRDYYLEGEMFKIIEATNTGGTTYTVIIEGASFYEFLTSEILEASLFTPSIGGGVSNITFTCTPSDTIYNYGLRIQGRNGFIINNIKVEHFNYAGVSLDKSYNVNIDTVRSKGGSDTNGLNYGIIVENGTKYVVITGLFGYGNRHTISGGGNGWAIPMYVNVISVTNTSDRSDLYGVDTHSSTANWTFGNIFSTNGFSIAGENHVVLSSYSTGGNFYLSYEGGYNLKFGTIHHFNPVRCYNQNGLVNCTLDKAVIEFSGGKLTDAVVLGWGRNSFNVKVGEMYYINNDIDTATSDINANAKSSVLFLRSNTAYDKLYVKGIKQIFFDAQNVEIKELVTVDCGWTGSVPATEGVIWLFRSSYNIKINRIKVQTTNPLLTFATTYIRGDGSAGVNLRNNINIQNIEETVITPYTTAITIPNQWTYVTLKDINLTGGKTLQEATGNIVENVNGLGNRYAKQYNIPDTIINFSNGTYQYKEISANTTFSVSQTYLGSRAVVQIKNIGASEVTIAVSGITFSESSNNVIAPGTSVYLNIEYVNMTFSAFINNNSGRLKQGTTAQRPATAIIGYQYFDTTLGKPIYLKSTGVWVDAAGTTV